MKTCGIEIDNNTVILLGLEKNEDGTFQVCQNSTKLTLADHESSVAVKEFANVLNSKIDAIGADAICIIKRQIKGQFAAGGISFKIEGLVQCYPKKEMTLIPSATIKAFLKKNRNETSAKYKYQQNALNAAFYLITK